MNTKDNNNLGDKPEDTPNSINDRVDNTTNHEKNIEKNIQEDLIKDEQENLRKDASDLSKASTDTPEAFAKEARENTEDFSNSAKEKFDEFSKDTKKKAETFSEEAKEKAEDFNDSAKKKFDEFSEDGKKAANDFADDAKEAASTFSEDAKKTLSDGKTVAIIAHLHIIGWIIAFILNSNNKTTLGSFYIRQTLGIFILSLLAFIPFIGLFIGLFTLILWIMSLINALGGNTKPVFAVGDKFQEWFSSI